MDKDTNIGRRPGGAERPQGSGASPDARAPAGGCRVSGRRRRCCDLLQGEDLEQVSRSLGVTAATLIGWRDAFVAAGEAALTIKNLPRAKIWKALRLKGEARGGVDRARPFA